MKSCSASQGAGKQMISPHTSDHTHILKLQFNCKLFDMYGNMNPKECGDEFKTMYEIIIDQIESCKVRRSMTENVPQWNI
jgi:hypothetical protein